MHMIKLLLKWIGQQGWCSPYYTCLVQRVHVVPARQSSTSGHPSIAHCLYSINAAAHKYPETIMQGKQDYRIELYTNSRKICWKGFRSILGFVMIT
jgi:hypothetical protein